MVNTNRVTASNVNSDDDTNRVTATNSNQITNSNFGRSFGNGWTIVDTSAETCTSTFSVTNYRRNKRKKFSILVWDNLVYLNIQIYKIIFLLFQVQWEIWVVDYIQYLIWFIKALGPKEGLHMWPCMFPARCRQTSSPSCFPRIIKLQSPITSLILWRGALCNCRHTSTINIKNNHQVNDMRQHDRPEQHCNQW